jgi:hypothetical protein
MKRKRTLLPVLVVALLLGLATGAAFAHAGADPGTTDTTAATDTTAPADTTAPTDTTTAADTATTATAPTTTTTTDPATTTDPGTTVGIDATVTSPTSGSNNGSVGQGADQANLSPPGSGPPPGSDCTTTPGSACGNNAATQIAFVSQQCKATSTVTLSLTITNADGTQAQNVSVDAPVQCNNIAQITQIVHQYCINCTLIVHQYDVTNVTNVTQNVTQSSTTVVNPPAFAAYCMPADKPLMRGDGTVGWLVFLQVDQAHRDPLYASATSASYDPSQGFMCPGTAPAPLPATFTLTVPSSLIGQYINLCVQPPTPKSQPLCHSIKIDNAATVTIPVAANVTATVSKAPAAKSKKAIAAASKGFLPKLKKTCPKVKSPGHKPCKPKLKTKAKVK